MRLADIGAHEAEARAARILAGLGFDAAAQAKPCSDFSGGWRMRVALAGVLFSEPDLLLLDEPTNYLDLEGTLWLERYLARYPHSAIVISHDRDLLNDGGRFDRPPLRPEAHLLARRLRFVRAAISRAAGPARQAASVKQEAERKHMQAFVERFRAKASKARQAQSRLKALGQAAADRRDQPRGRAALPLPRPGAAAPPADHPHGRRRRSATCRAGRCWQA